MDKKILTEKEAAQYMSISTSTLRQARMNRVRIGKMMTPPFVRLGRSIRYLKEDIDRWFESNKVDTSKNATKA